MWISLSENCCLKFNHVSFGLSHTQTHWARALLLTRLLEDGAPLVVGRSQARSSDIVEACFVNASVKDPQQRLLLLPLGHDFVVDEGGEHLCFNEVREERQVGLWLVGQEGGL